ncbi:MAG: hypothetical protein WA364_03155 [Candidatus Nitrosopolaris sp.]|jgi:hypothetical protein
MQKSNLESTTIETAAKSIDQIRKDGIDKQLRERIAAEESGNATY